MFEQHCLGFGERGSNREAKEEQKHYPDTIFSSVSVWNKAAS